MTDRHLPCPNLTDFDAATIRHGINVRVADVRRGRMPPMPIGARGARPAGKCLETEAR